MPHYNLPHNHGQKMASVLEKCRPVKISKALLKFFPGLVTVPGSGYYGCYVTVRNAPII